MQSAYNEYLTKQAIGADMAVAANHFVGGMQHTVAHAKLRAGAFMNHHIEDTKGKLVNAIAERVAAHAAPHIDNLAQPHMVGEIIASKGVQDATREHIHGAIDRHLGDALSGNGLVSGAVEKMFGKRKQAHELYFTKLALVSNNAADSGSGIAPHDAGPILRPAFHVPPVSEWGGKGFTPATAEMPALHGGKALAPSIAHMLSKHAAGFTLFGSPSPKAEERAYMDPAMASKIVRAKAGLSRAKLMYGAGFKKLSEDEQQSLLKAHDRYHRTLEDAALAGHGGY